MSRRLWLSIKAELQKWSEDGHTARFWLRDDDACDVTPGLERLAAFARRHGVSIGLAVIPEKLTSELVSLLRDPRSPFVPMCHGWDHSNWGTAARPAEFGMDRPLTLLVADVIRARETHIAHFGSERPVFVPPFGAISNELSARMGDLGFALVSNGNSLAEARMVRIHGMTSLVPMNPFRPSRIRRLDVHLDPIDWRAKTAQSGDVLERRLLGELRARRKRYIAMERPIGILTHHLVHDEAIWSVCEDLVTFLRGRSGVAFPDLEQLVGGDAPIAVPSVVSSRDYRPSVSTGDHGYEDQRDHQNAR